MPFAARVGDDHKCPVPSHVGGPILPPGSVTVLIENMPAAKTTDTAVCCGSPPDLLAMGCPTVLIDHQLAVRVGDLTAHGGFVVGGATTVQIGVAGDGAAIRCICPPAAPISRSPSPPGTGSHSTSAPQSNSAPQDTPSSTSSQSQASTEESSTPTTPKTGDGIEPDGIVDDGIKEHLKSSANDAGDAAAAEMNAARESLANDVKLRWGQIDEIERDIAGGGGSAERLKSLQILRSDLLAQQYRDAPDEAAMYLASKNHEAFLNGTTTAIGGLFALDELAAVDRDRAAYLQQYGAKESWKHDMGAAAKYVASSVLSVPNKLGLIGNVAIPEAAEGIGEKVGDATYSTGKDLAKWLHQLPFWPKNIRPRE